MFRWYVVNTYSGHENKVQPTSLHRASPWASSRSGASSCRPSRSSRRKDGQKVQAEKRTLPGYVLVHMEMDGDAWRVVKDTPA